jgi:error-prone DNA polymerase
LSIQKAAPFRLEGLAQQRAIPTSALNLYKDGMILLVAGLVLVRQRPGVVYGVCFITIEDETGFFNPVLFEKYRKEILRAKLVMVEGKLQREGRAIFLY